MSGTGGPVFDAERRAHMATAFMTGGDHYHRIRPGYPQDSLDWLLAGKDHVAHALDIGAGTGKYTALLKEAAAKVTAIDPSADMLGQLSAELPTVSTVVGVAEKLDLPEACADLAVLAQAWHWCDPLAASTEIARVLRPGGVLGLVWNQLDVSVPWVLRLSRIMHAGDVHKPDFRPTIGPEFARAAAHETHWTQQLTPQGVIELAKSRSYYLKANSETRAKVEANLRWYLFEHLGYTPGQEILLPYMCQSWRTIRL